eukprot:TRINITY_DN12018_c0_g1_i1.p2 TRINITY_DN12018_c0_g1~~TRINITY_DN12018_c0_g1_i1.p2  ORF type:complete len:155 (+),score=21.79 TRINITY_DN12018_c0_g1_i1:257-721(+)
MMTAEFGEDDERIREHVQDMDGSRWVAAFSESKEDIQEIYIDPVETTKVNQSVRSFDELLVSLREPHFVTLRSVRTGFVSFLSERESDCYKMLAQVGLPYSVVCCWSLSIFAWHFCDCFFRASGMPLLQFSTRSVVPSVTLLSMSKGVLAMLVA